MSEGSEFNYAVLERAGDGLNVVHANGDLAAARADAEKRALASAGKKFMVVQLVNEVVAELQPKWARP